MHLYQILVVVAIATVGLCIPVQDSNVKEPERCCIVNQFSSKTIVATTMVLPDGTHYKSYAHYNFSYDANRQMVGLKGVTYNVPDQTPTKLWIIEDFKTGVTYTYIIDTKHCDKSINLLPTYKCIPDSAIYITSSNFGYGDKQIIGDTWLVKMNDTLSYSTVSRGDCVPLVGNLFINHPEISDSLTTTDFVPRIDDPSIFDIPAECQRL